MITYAKIMSSAPSSDKDKVLVSALKMDLLKKDLLARADTAYVSYIQQMKQPLCLGHEQKIKDGIFGTEEINALMQAAEQLGRHKAFHEALTVLTF